MQVIQAIVATLIVLIVVAVVLALPVMLLWNAALVGAINGVNEISFFQALGISLLCAFLFRSGASKD